MGLGGSGWVKKLLRGDPRLSRSLHYASYSKARRHEKPVGAKDKGRGVERGFDVVMVELMLRKHALVKGCQGLHMFYKRWRNLAAEQVARFPDAHTLIFLFDDETNVPQAKGETQRKRRKAGAGFSQQDLQLLGPFRYLCNSDPDEFDRRVRVTFETEAMQRAKAGRTAVSAFEIFISKHMRTPGLRADEFEFATRCIVSGPYADLGPGRRIVVDRGVWRPSFERRLADDRYRGGEEEWTSVTRSFAPRLGEANEAHRAWIHMDRWGVRKMEAMEGQHLVGEADLKIPRYARLFAGRDVYVVCHDTDLLPILLMTAKDWIPGDRPSFRGRLWLDMTTPSDEKPSAPRRTKSLPAALAGSAADAANPAKPAPLRGVVDILQLWTDLHHWFAAEFVGIQNPIEVFCLLLIAMGTDYVKNPPTLGPVKLWKAFKERRLCNVLREAVLTDGHMGSALPVDEDTARLLVAPTTERDGTEATQLLVRALLRDLTRGAFYARGQAERGPQHCPPGHRTRHVSFRESALIQFLLKAYHAVGSKDPTKWPDRTWMQAQARRLGWQLAYWYGGDTREGRALEDEMACGDDDTALSVHGWHWTDDPDCEFSRDPHEGAAEGSVPPKKRKAGCLDRRRPQGKISEPAPRVLDLDLFRQRGLKRAKTTA